MDKKIQWGYTDKSAGNITTYAAESREDAISKASAYFDLLGKHDRKYTEIKVISFDVEREAQTYVDEGYFETIAEATEALTVPDASGEVYMPFECDRLISIPIEDE